MKATHVSLAASLASTVSLAVACGGSQPPAETAPPAAAPPAASAEAAPAASAPAPEAAPAGSAAPAGAAAPAAAAPAEPAKPAWKDLTVDQKKEVMKNSVLPAMKTAFQELDAKRFANMSCTTCHGDGAKQGKFTMPNPKLPKLDPAGGFEKHMKKDPKITKFMMEHVAPDMAKILGVPPFDMQTNQGFGCGSCHTFEGMKAEAPKADAKKAEAPKADAPKAEAKKK